MTRAIHEMIRVKERRPKDWNSQSRDDWRTEGVTILEADLL